jgi:hypothetical protein
MWLKQGKLIGDYAHRESARSSVEGQNVLLGCYVTLRLSGLALECRRQ